MLAKYTDAAITTRHLLYKAGSNKEHVAVTATAADLPLGTIPSEAPGAESFRAFAVLGIEPGPLTMVASEAIDVGEEVFTAASGKVQNRPTASGTYWQVGVCVQDPATADGDEIKVAHCPAIKLVIP